jgi:hypothetical protein
MARQGPIEYKAESFYSIAPLAKLLKKHLPSLPILAALQSVVKGKRSAALVFKALFADDKI